MNTSFGCTIAVCTALAGSAALAQTSTSPSTLNQPVHKPGPPPACQSATPQTANLEGARFAAEQSVQQWRAPKLIGVAVYSADDRQVGVVKDVLIGHDGIVQVVVIGVGGFLGLGAKDVGVPFDWIEWRTEARVVPTDQPTVNPLSAANTAPREIDAASAEASQGYPDKAVLNVTLAQLRSAPGFQYAPAPIAKLRPSPGGTPLP